MKKNALIIAAFVVLALSACVYPPTPVPTATPTATATLVPTPTQQATATVFPDVTPIGRWDAIADCISGTCLVFDNKDLDTVVDEIDDEQVVTVIDVRQAADNTLTCFLESLGWVHCSQVDDVCGYCNDVCLPYDEFFECVEAE